MTQFAGIVSINVIYPPEGYREEAVDAVVAQEIQLMIEYNPARPYRGGSPSVAPAALVQNAIRTRQRVQSDRRIVAERAATRLDPRASGSNGSLASCWEHLAS
jgi:hypothetical protein